jgi:hypothetical protein
VDFLLDGTEKYKRHFSENPSGEIFIDANTRTLFVTLTERCTACRSLRVQAGGRTNERGLIRTPMSETITFNRSVGAGYSDHCAYDCGPTALLRDLVRDSHFHTNLELLNRLTEPLETGGACATDDDIIALFQ